MAPPKWRIMAVDDDRDILELIRMTLMDQYEIFTFDEPMEAYKSLDTVEPDLVILDIMMPKMTGYQVVELMKSSAHFKNTPVVFLSAKDTNRDIKYGYKLGAVVYLTKPFQPDRLLRNIDAIFQKNPPSRSAKSYSSEEVANMLQGHVGTRDRGMLSPGLVDEISDSIAQGSKPGAGGDDLPEDDGPDWLN